MNKMKYMTFPSSCSYAGLANLLGFRGLDVEDREIVLQMDLPYLFARENGRYISGAMLQGARWFDLYLRPLGLALREDVVDREGVCRFLGSHPPAMLGLRIAPGRKHAVIFTGVRNGKYRFLNNKRQLSPEPEILVLTKNELHGFLEETVVIGLIEEAAPVQIDRMPYFAESVTVLESMWEAVDGFCGRERSEDAIREAMETMFRALLLDGVAMLDLIGEVEISGGLKTIRGQLLNAVKGGGGVRLSEKLDMGLLRVSIRRYMELVCHKLNDTGAI